MTKLFVAILGSLILGACSSPTAGGDDTAPNDAGVELSASCMEATSHSDLTWIQANVFSTSCTFSGCHSAPASSAGHLVLQSGQSQVELVGVATETATPWTRVVPGQPDMSYLMVAIGGATGPAPKGGTMPLGESELCEQKRDAIARWITAGASAD